MPSPGTTRPIERALISVSDKAGLVDFGRRLVERGVELLSTGGTAGALRDAGLPVTDVAEFTGSPEILDGRVKTLHPKVHGGILFRRDDPEHVRTCEAHGIRPIDLVVVNLYPFLETIRRPGVTRPEAIEQIDIGGPTLLRSAAKNHASVTVVCRPDLYDAVLAEIESGGGQTTPALRERLALEAFRHTAEYDRAISDYLARETSGAGAPESALADALPPDLSGAIADCRQRSMTLRYGENSHQPGGFYGELERHLEKLHGIELSYNNILDLSAAVELIEEFPGARPVAAIIKHTNPCGVALGDTPQEAWKRALATDSKSAHGGVVAFNRPIDRDTATAIHDFFSEIIAAPDFDAGALEVLRSKKNRRLIRILKPLGQGPQLRIRSAAGGLLVQTADPPQPDLDLAACEVVTRRKPTATELDALAFAWRVVKHLKSNAIAFASADRTLALGAGQVSRVDAALIAVLKARATGIELAGSAAASDAFFPFPDGLLACADAGATAVIQPGGARKDAEVIAAADGRDMAMVFTGTRHFRH